MKLEDVKKMTKAPEMPLGTTKAVFEKVQYRTDANDDVTGVFVHVKGFKSLYIPFFATDNFQLDLLLNQLDCDSYNDEEINKNAGKEITVTRYTADNYTNVSFNPNYKTGANELA